MVFGNRDDNSGTGVGFTRDPATGAKGAYGDFLVNAQGEDVVAGIRNTEPLSALETEFPPIYAELMDIFARLEAHYRDMCDTEFTIEQGKLWMLQTRVGKRTGRAALRMAVDMVDDPAIHLTHAEALQRVTPDHVEAVLHPQFADHSAPGARQGARRLSRCRRRRRCASPPTTPRPRPLRGEHVILVRNETSPEDVHGMLAAEGILTARGGLVQPRRRRRPRLGQAGRRRRRGAADQRLREALPRRRHGRAARATSSRSTAPRAPSSSAPWRSPPPRRRRS